VTAKERRGAIPGMAGTDSDLKLRSKNGAGWGFVEIQLNILFAIVYGIGRV
jgi:hypothetical protein